MASLPQSEPSLSFPLAEVNDVGGAFSRVRLSNYNALVARVVDVFGDEVKASRWLSQSNDALFGDSPLQAAFKQGYDAEILEPLLVRIEHGIDE